MKDFIVLLYNLQQGRQNPNKYNLFIWNWLNKTKWFKIYVSAEKSSQIKEVNIVRYI